MIPRVVALLVAVAVAYGAVWSDSVWLALFAGGYLALLARDAGEAALHAMRPSSRAERRMAEAQRRAIETRRQALQAGPRGDGP